MTTTLPLDSHPSTGIRGTATEGVEVRPLTPGDGAAVQAVFAGMGPRARELRFLTAKPRLTSSDLRRLTSVDQRDHVAVLASSAQDHRPIGIARFIRDTGDPGSAEVAVSVVDAWQSRGVGTMLVGELARQAVQAGVRRFTMLMSADNVGALRLLLGFPGDPSRLDVGHGLVEYAVSLAGEPS